MDTIVSPILLEAIGRGVTPGAVVAVTDNDEPTPIIARGRTSTYSGPGPNVSVDTVYDVASLTKVATVSLLVRLAETGIVSLNDRLIDIAPPLRTPSTEPLTIGQLVGHCSGLPAHVEMFRRIWAGDLAGQPSGRHALVRMAATAELVAEPGSTTCYSDLGYILLGAALETAAGVRLDRAVSEHVLRPLGMEHSFYVDLEHQWRPSGVAPTEVCEVRGLVQGEVHDENAHSGGGICGHAGLFSTAADVGRLAQAWADAMRDRGHLAGTVARTLVATPSTPGSTWRLGFDTPSVKNGISHAGDRWPKDGFGHLGFTGCSMWIDPPRGRHVVMLSNRVHPTRHGTGIAELRRNVMDGVVGGLDDGSKSSGP